MVRGVSSPVFVGRRHELGRLAAAFEEASAGRPRMILVAGEAGVGKTRLVTELAALATARGARALSGGCLPAGEVGLPYAPFAEAIRRLVRSVEPSQVGALLGSSRVALARLVPDLTLVLAGSTPPPDQPLAPFEVVLGALRSLARSAPLVLVVEDLHWADRSTLDVVAYLVRDLLDERVLLVGTFRTDELYPRHPLRGFVAELERTRRVERLDLAPFDRSEMRELLASVVGHEPEPALVTAIHARSGGNAYYAEELLALGGAEGLLPSTLREVLLARIDSLGEPTRRMLRLASAAGPRIDADVLAQVGNVAESSLATRLRDAVGHHVLVPLDADGDRFAFRHALLGEAVYTELLPGERRRLHARFAQALQAGGAADPVLAAELAHHWAMAGDRRRALEASIRAGHAARSVPAFASAQAQFERAAQLWPLVPDAGELARLDLPAVLELAADCAGAAGATTRAVAHLRAAIVLVDAGVDPVRAGLLHDRLGEFAGRSGDTATATRAHAEAVRLVPPLPPSGARARVVEGLARRLMLDRRHEEAARLARVAIELARQTGAGGVEANALATLGAAESGDGHADVADEILRHGRDLALGIGDAAAAGRAWADLAANLEGEECVREALAAADWNAEHGFDRSTGSYALLIAIEALWELGRWTEAAGLIERIRFGMTEPVYEHMAEVGRARIELGRGDREAVARQLPAIRDLVAGDGMPEVEVSLADLESRFRLASGDPAAAREAATAGLAVFASLPIGARAGGCWILATALRLDADLATLARRRRDKVAQAEASARGEAILTGARALVDSVEAAGASRWRRPRALLVVCEAEASRLAGERSEGRWLHAAGATAEAGQVHARPYALMRLAEAMLARGSDRAAVTGTMREAHALARSMGAEPIRLTVEALARRARVSLEPGPARDQPAAGAGARGALTPREQEVLELVAAGCSNRQIADRLFIGERTAGVHVSNILTKLGVERRTEAVAVGRQLGLLDDAVALGGQLLP